MELLTLSKIIENEAKKANDRERNGFMNKIEATKSCLEQILAHAAMHKRPLTLGQFVPCKDGVPLEKPSSYDFFKSMIVGKTYTTEMTEEEHRAWAKSCHDYQEAEKRVLFKGFEVIESHNDGLDHILSNGKIKVIHFSEQNWTELYFRIDIDVQLKIKTISDLANATQENPIELNQYED